MRRKMTDLTNDPFDVLIVGGGIYGAALAWMASNAGLSTALIEKGDFGQSTSSNSQKIIHGGLRYLQSLDFRRTYQSIKAQRRLAALAPHLIDPLQCVMPIYGHGVKGREAFAAGFFLYNFLGRRRNSGIQEDKHLSPCRVVSKRETLRLIPEIDPTNLTGGGVWFDALCQNTERLLLGFIKSAYRSGAAVANYVRAEKIHQQEKDRILVECSDQITKNQLAIRTKKVVNCCGPWVKELVDEEQKSFESFHFAAGINIITRKLFPHQTAVGLWDNHGPSRRLYFIVPWRNKSIVGTEWFPFQGKADNFRVTEQHCRSLIKGVNRAYPSASLSMGDIHFLHGGLVPCHVPETKAADTGKNLFHSFRIIDHSKFGLGNFISVVGVKYTTAVDVAEKVLGLICPGFQNRSNDENLFMEHGPMVADGALRVRLANKYGIPEDDALSKRLTAEYGPEIDRVVSHGMDANGSLSGPRCSSDLTASATSYAIEKEMALTLADILFRRTGIGADGTVDEKVMNKVASVASGFLGWSQSKIQVEIAEVRRVANVGSFLNA